MSKIYDEYLKLKKQDNTKYYLFKSGMFYIFIDEDAENITNYLPLKITKLNDKISKCGFPRDSLEKYMNILKNIEKDVVIIENITNDRINLEKKIIKRIKNLNLNNITPVECFNILSKFKDMLNE